MMSCRQKTQKKIKYEIRRYILEQFGAKSLHSIGLFELQTPLNKLARTLNSSRTGRSNGDSGAGTATH
jgi:hypothetical protein